MPCRDFYDEHPAHFNRACDEAANVRKIAFAESALCQALEALSKVSEDPLSLIDYREAGISKVELERWWRQHKIQDAARRGGFVVKNDLGE